MGTMSWVWRSAAIGTVATLQECRPRPAPQQVAAWPRRRASSRKALRGLYCPVPACRSARTCNTRKEEQGSRHRGRREGRRGGRGPPIAPPPPPPSACPHSSGAKAARAGEAYRHPGDAVTSETMGEGRGAPWGRRLRRSPRLGRAIWQLSWLWLSLAPPLASGVPRAIRLHWMAPQRLLCGWCSRPPWIPCFPA